MTNINLLLHQLKERMSRAQLSDMDTLASYLVLVLKSIQLLRLIKSSGALDLTSGEKIDMKARLEGQFVVEISNLQS